MGGRACPWQDVRMTQPAPSHAATPSIGTLLRRWRTQRRLSQLALAVDADISSRHLSFIETGRAVPSREMVLHLGECLQLPLRERNRLLTAAGFAPTFGERSLDAPELRAMLDALRLVLDGHEPYPAMVVDRHWNLQLANAAARRLLTDIAPDLLQPPINLLRLSLHPQALAPRIINLGEWRAYVLSRLRALIAHSGDAGLIALCEELSGYPPLAGETRGARSTPHSDVVVLLRLRVAQGELALFGTITLFGSPIEVTLSELALEAFYPADPTSAALLRQMADAAV